jgi:hypothetical protein
MPSASKSQARLMAAAAHTPGGYGGVPQSVGKDFNAADTAAGNLAKGSRLPDRLSTGHKVKRHNLRSRPYA